MGEKSEKIKNYAEKLGSVASRCKVGSITVGKTSKRIPSKVELDAYTAGMAVACGLVGLYADGSVTPNGTPYAKDPVEDFENAVCMYVNRYSEISKHDGGDDA